MASLSALAKTFEITTSMRSDSSLQTSSATALYDPGMPSQSQLYMLPRHRDRMLAAVKAFGWPEATQRQIFSLGKQIRAHLLSKFGDEDFGDPLKVRVTLSFDGTLIVTSTRVAAVLYSSLFPKSLSDLLSCSGNGSSPTFRIFVSSVSLAASPFTRHKTTNRKHYDDVRAKAMPLVKNSEDKADHLLIELLLTNSLGEIMEGTFTTPYFKRGGQWITPFAACGGNLGTTRQHTLDQALCKEGIVRGASVRRGEKVVLSNGVRGFGWGIVEELEEMERYHTEHET